MSATVAMQVLMKTLQEVVGALKGGKGNAFPPPVQHFLHSHTFEAFHASLKNFCKGLIYEAPEPCLLEVSALLLIYMYMYPCIHVAGLVEQVGQVWRPPDQYFYQTMPIFYLIN